MKGYFIKSMTVFVMVFVLLSGCGTRTAEVTKIPYGVSDSSAAHGEDFYFPKESVDPESEEPDLIKVFVCGAVLHAGVYSVPAGSRLGEAIELAGGMSADADPDYLNQARVLTDGEQIRVPTKAETEGMQAPAMLIAKTPMVAVPLTELHLPFSSETTIRIIQITAHADELMAVTVPSRPSSPS